MLELRDVTITAGKAPGERFLLQKISAQFSQGKFHAIVGPSGCGKSTLLKAIAGLRPPTAGSVHWDGRDLDEHDLDPHEIGYVPQFGIAFDNLRVDESVEVALRLRVGGLNAEERKAEVARLLSEVGLGETADRRVGVLSGGQKRRLALALEMVSAPLLLLSDEVTSGLDPKAESEIVHLLHRISRKDDRSVISVTHSLRHLDLHDTVAVLYQGHLIYHAAPHLLTHYFRIDHPENLFPALGSRSVEEWQKLWTEHEAHYQSKPAVEVDVSSTPSREFRKPDRLTQFATLLRRRWTLFLRDRGQIGLQLVLLFGFPCLVVVFAWGGLPQIQNLIGNSSNAVQQLLETAAFTLRSFRVASLVSGLVMFQVILLALMGSNNSAREIAGERAIFEKEKFAGLSPFSYIASKVAFLSVLLAVQSIWMGVFVSIICRFPGNLLTQCWILGLTNAAMTFVCLAISSMTASPENASLLSVYLVGFQLPLSGAVLALPRVLGLATRPFIAAFWGWSGYLQTMRDTRFYDFVQSMSQTELLAIELCIWVLIVHIAGGILLAYLGVQRSRWE